MGIFDPSSFHPNLKFCVEYGAACLAQSISDCFAASTLHFTRGNKMSPHPRPHKGGHDGVSRTGRSHSGGRMYLVRRLIARHRDYVLVDWAPSRQREYQNSWIPAENLSTDSASNSLTRHPGWFESLPEMSAEEAAEFHGLGP
jgi:hypothetical protein